MQFGKNRYVHQLIVNSTFNFKDNEIFAIQGDHKVTMPNLASWHFNVANEPPGKLSLEVIP